MLRRHERVACALDVSSSILYLNLETNCRISPEFFFEVVCPSYFSTLHALYPIAGTNASTQVVLVTPDPGPLLLARPLRLNTKRVAVWT